MTVNSPGNTVDSFAVDGVIFATAAQIGGLLELHRVANVNIANSMFTAAIQSAGLSTYETSGVIQKSYFSGLQPAVAPAAGYGSYASQITVSGNSFASDGVGVLLVGTSEVPEAANQLVAKVEGNVFQDDPFGVRIMVIGLVGSTSTNLMEGRISGLVRGNQFRRKDNTGDLRAVVVDAGFPSRTYGTGCDQRTFTGIVNLTLQTNTAGSDFVSPLITFTRMQIFTNPLKSDTLRSQFKYLEDASFAINDRDHFLDGAQIDDPLTDPYNKTPCPADPLHLLDNTLTINGKTYTSN